MSLVTSDDLDTTGTSLDNVEKALRTATSNPAPVDSDNAGEPKADPSSIESQLPAKFRGKSAAEIAQIYLDLERRHGQVVNDLGVQRKLTDRLLDLDRNDKARQAQSETASRPVATELSSTELLTDPAGAIRKVLQEETQQLVTPTLQRMQKLEMQLAEERFLAKHKNCREISATPEFKEWISSSPVRQRTADQAAGGDITAADALFTDYEQHLQATAASAQTTGDDVVEARKVGLETAGNAGTASSGKAGQIYKRADLIRLRVERPDVYRDPTFQEEILKAYAEGRVR